MARVRVALRHAAMMAQHGRPPRSSSATSSWMSKRTSRCSTARPRAVPRQFRLLTALDPQQRSVLTHKQLAMAASADDLSGVEVPRRTGCVAR